MTRPKRYGNNWPKSLRPIFHHWNNTLRVVGFLLILLSHPVQAAPKEGTQHTVDPTLLADTLYAKGDWAAATDAYQAILKKQPFNAHVMEYMARCFVAVGRYEDALTLLESNDEAPSVTAYTGELLLNYGREREAEGLLLATLDVAPSNLRALYQLGRLYQLRGERGVSEKYFQKLLQQINRDSITTAETEGFVGLACKALSYKSGPGIDYYKKAKDHLSLALLKDKRAFQYYTELGVLFQTKDNPAEARKVFDEILVMNEHWVDARVGLAESLAASGLFTDALMQLDIALTTNPHHPGAHALIAMIRYSHDDVTVAKHHLDKALAVTPHAVSLLAIQASMALLDGHTERFDEIVKQVTAINRRPSRFYEAMARVMQNRFRFDRAIAFSRKAIALDPDNWNAYAVLALNLLRTGEEKEARSLLTQQHEHDGYNTVVFNMLQLSDHLNENFITTTTPHFILRVHKDEHSILTPYALDLLEEAYATLSRKYDFTPEGPILVEIFKKHKFFAARTTGLPGLYAAGACFGKVITADSPTALRGSANWGSVLWHEFAHVITVQQSDYRVPRWLTEGLSEYEQQARYPEWDRDQDEVFLNALLRNELVSVSDLSNAFRGSLRTVLASYFQSGLLAEFTADRWGFEAIPMMLHKIAKGATIEAVIQDQLKISVAEYDRRFIGWAKERYAAYQILPAYGADDLDALKAACHAAPNNTDCQIRLAKAQLDSRKFKAAHASAQAVLKQDPSAADAYTILGTIQLQRHNRKAAMRLFLKALAGNPADRYTPNQLLGLLYEQTGRGKQAIAHYEAAVTAFPRKVAGRGRPILLHKLVALYKRVNNPQGLKRSLERIVQMDERDIPSRLALNALYRAKGERDKQLPILRQINYINPFHPNHHEELGDLLLRDGDAKRAAVEFNAALILKAGNPVMLSRKLAKAYIEQKDRKAALALLNRLMKKKPKDPDLKKLHTHATALAKPIPLDPVEARRLLRSALEDWARYQQIIISLNNPVSKELPVLLQSVIEQSQRATQTDPQYRDAKELYLLALLADKQYDVATSFARQSIKKIPSFTTGHLLLARSLYALSEAEQDVLLSQEHLKQAIHALSFWLKKEPLSPFAQQEQLTLAHWQREVANVTQ